MANVTPFAQKYYPPVSPKIDPEVQQHLKLLYNATNDHDQAIVQLAGQVQSAATAAATPTTSTNTATTTTVTQIAGFPGLGDVNNQTGTSYTFQSTDSGSLVTLKNAGAIAVTLNSMVGTPYLVFLTNYGPGTATLTPSSGTVNGAASFALPANYTSIVFFDGVNWWATAMPVVPQTVAVVAHQWLNGYNAATGTWSQSQPAYSDISGTPVLPANTPATTHQFFTAYNSTTGAFTAAQPAYSDLTGTPTLAATKTPVASNWLTGYNASTGAFSAAQPAFSDISGNLTTSQLPTAGASGTISLAALTVGGTPGSITVTNGLITAFTNPT